MTLGFKDIFVPFVMDGTKPHTLRTGENWRMGMTIQFYRNVRTRNQAKIRPDGMARVVQKAEIKRHEEQPCIFIDGRCLTPLEAQELARKDGFQDFVELLEFIDQIHGLPWKGQLIGWTNLRY